MTRTFSYRVLESSWGVAIDLTAKASYLSIPPTEAIKIEDRLWLDLSHANLSQVDRSQLESGLHRVASDILQFQPTSANIVISIFEIWYVPTDYQPEGVQVAMIAWAAEEFGLSIPPIEVDFDRSTNCYIFHLP